MSNIIPVNAKSVEPFKETPDFAGKRLYMEEAVNVVELTVKPHRTVAEHQTPVDVFFYVLEGSGTVSVGGNEDELVTGDLVFSPANVPHGLRNPYDEGFRLLVVKVPGE